MPATAKTTHRGTTLTFTEEDHRYTDCGGQDYTSATTFIGRYFPKFDPESTAKRMVKEGKGESREALIRSWDAERDHACRYGTRCHEIAESVLQDLEIPHSPESEKEKAAFASIWDYCSKTILPNAEALECEKMVFAHSWAIAGTVDLLLQRPNGDFMILDWKTNKRIRREGYQGRTAKIPIEHLPDCEFTKYSLQLNLYERILRREDYLPAGAKVDRGLLYVNPDTHEGVQYIEVPFMQSDISLMLIEHLESREVPF